MKILSNTRIVTNGHVIENGWVAIDGDRIDSYGTGTRAEGLDLGGSILTPGFVDMHVHGAGGYDFGDPNAEASSHVVNLHRAHGTTTLLAGIGSDTIPRMCAAAHAAVGLHENGDVAGVFFEGPFLSLERKGAHLPAHLRRPDRAELAELLDAAQGTAALMTIAPELDGAIALIRSAVERRVTVAVGHTDAEYDQVRAAFDAGARVATHLFNGMRPIHHREPGPVIAAMEDDRITCELIADGFHVAPTMIQHVFKTIGPSRIALITDAIEATGVGDGIYHRSGSTTVVRNGLAMLEDGSSIAGSTLTMDRAVRNTVRRAGVALPAAVQAATATPAHALGIDNEVGSIAPGLSADLVVLDDALRVIGVMRRGTWITDPLAAPSGDSSRCSAD